MSDVLTPAQRHRNMAAIRSSATKPELILRKALWRLGLRYRVNDKRLPGKPDIVFPKYRTVVFVHGCFWHGHQGCKNFTIPKTNTDFWTAKILCNQERDKAILQRLKTMEWKVIIIWECELKGVHLSETISSVAKALHQNIQIKPSSTNLPE